MEEAKNYGDALKRQFDIVMPSDVVSKRAEELGKVFTQGRYSIDVTREKAPLSI
jgi:hypothetical protein